MRLILFFCLFLSLSAPIAYSRPEIRSVSADAVSVKQYPFFDSDHEVWFQADKVCRKFGKKASEPVGQSCDPMEQLCVNPIIHFACIGSSRKR